MSLALYRKYRPGTFAEVKGQEHVTDPLRQALRSGRINHAYLFSGPRGCGKTSSARILARSLNCEKGPTPDPCGECESCVALAPTGPGHLDVIEIDAASHGGVDDARDLRERAFFAPVSSRFKIYIIDEAHMVTREGFNALLKLVEEPPPHLKFVFATTEPEKVIGTIKSRTHHYPFRLIPPAALRALMEEILTSEKVPFEPAALPLVVRAGAGSARDSLSILDQLFAGSDEAGITYARAVSLLGYTDGDLLDDVVAAFAGRDGAQVFQVVNRVIEGGHDPRRFAMDLLERFRDLVILANVPEAATSGLLDRPGDELERLQVQAASMGPAELTRAAEILNAGLIEMRGAASPRLLLELMCARILLPGAAQGEAALLTRLERLEKGGVVPAPAPVALPQRDPAPVVNPAPPSRTATPAGAPSAAAGSAGQGDDWPAAARPGAPGQGQGRQGQPQAPVQQAPEAAGAFVPADRATASAPEAGAGTGAVQQAWPQVLAALKRRSIVVWANVNTNAQVVGVEGKIVTLGFAQVGAMKNFTGGGKDAVVAAVLQEVLGGTWKVEAVVGNGPPPSGGSRPPAPRHPPAPQHPAPQADQTSQNQTSQSQAARSQQAPARQAPASGPSPAVSREAPSGQAPSATDESWPDAPMPEDPGSPPPPNSMSSPGLAAARSAAKAAAQAGPRAKTGAKAAAWPDAVPPRGDRGTAPDADEVDPLNDADADVDALSGMALLQRELGGQVIGEIDHT
ncbi:DNA polymerase III subunit gamma and tau [Streptosporangium sp. NPDC049046]|uniref:DNA polymerase III subunit gamma and tau n=1 Tax=Streptosporangium sp. NPDC049046 TaxID=3155031 RepID=UPI00343BB436